MSFLPGVHETLGHVSTESRSVLYTGIVLYSTDDPEADAVLVSDGMIAWTGSQDTARLIHDDAEVVDATGRSEEHTSELQSRGHLVCRLLLEKKRRPLRP